MKPGTPSAAAIEGMTSASVPCPYAGRNGTSVMARDRRARSAQVSTYTEETASGVVDSGTRVAW
ncbi:hypothetical protein Acsp07_08280 [Actinomycetospora sp. NBRC 106378]|nr:hypothetical protein Acsp07_08280 [Actinomycetospora sp. NBRC 106378]